MMKGIAHFASGLCVATFVPGVVEASAAGSLLIPLAGAFAMLPDFLDFRFAKFLQKRHAEVIPVVDCATDPQLTARTLAQQLAAQLQLVRTTGCRRVVQLHPRRLGVIDWATWTVRFDDAAACVTVRFRGRAASVPVPGLAYGYDGELEAGELGGPALSFEPGPDGVTRVEFLPWHRTWSHSLVLALVCGVLAWLMFGALAGVVCALGFAVHVLEDQLGYMGSNLFWPFTRGRARGMELLHSGDAIPNFLVVWTSLALMLLNLDRGAVTPRIEAAPYLLGVVVVPACVLLLRYVRRRVRAATYAGRQRDALAEGESGGAVG